MAYKSELERFDMERGNALTLTLDTATELAELPCEICAPIIHALLRWFTGGELKPIADSLPDPRDRATFMRLVAHQRVNAGRRADYLASRQKNGRGRKRQRHGGAEGGDDSEDDSTCRHMPAHANTCDKYKYKSKSKRKRKDLDENEVVRDADASPPAGSSACALPADLPAQSGKTVLYFDGFLWDWDSPTHALDDTTFKEKEPMVSHTITEADFKADPVTALLPCADGEESDKAKFRNTLIARYKANPRQFMLVAWKYLAEAHNARIALVNALRGKCAQCETHHDTDCNTECQHAYVKDRLADYAKNYGCEVFARNLCGRLKVLKPPKK